jgi:hypothetical protein
MNTNTKNIMDTNINLHEKAEDEITASDNDEHLLPIDR